MKHCRDPVGEAGKRHLLCDAAAAAAAASSGDSSAAAAAAASRSQPCSKLCSCMPCFALKGDLDCEFAKVG